MAKLQLNAGESIIGSGMMAYQEPEGMLRYRSWHGNIYITNQRAFFRMSMTGISMMDLPLSEIRGFTASKSFFVPEIKIYSRNGENFKFTGFLAKKLKIWLLQAGLPSL